MFGVSAKSLGQFVTTEKDMMKNVNHLPTDYYLIGNENSKIDDKNNNKKLKNDDEFDDGLDDYFDFVFIEREEFE